VIKGVKMDRHLTLLLQDGDPLPPSAQKIEGLLDQHFTKAVLTEMEEFSKVFRSLSPKLYGGYEEEYVEVPNLIGEDEVRVVYTREPPYNMPPGNYELFRHLQMDLEPDINGNMSTRRRLVQEELESLRNSTLRDDGENVDRFYYPFLVLVHDLNLGIFSADLKVVAAYTLGYTGSCCDRHTLRSGAQY
jgi:hypothetical protein